MKKVLLFLLTAMLLISFSSVAYAKPMKHKEFNNKHSVHVEKDQQKGNKKPKKEKYSFSGVSVIKYGRYQLPIKAVTQGMGATVAFDNFNAVLTIAKDATTIKIDFFNKKVYVNDVEDTTSGIFTVRNSKKRIVLIKYIAEKLGVRVSVDKDKITIEGSSLNAPKNIIITPVGGTVVNNTLNSTTQYLNVSAEITPGQAVGGRAELYVGNRLVATNTAIATSGSAITASGSAIQFTTSDGSPTNEELKALIPEGGVVTIKLYNAKNECAVSKANIKLNVDYVAPVVLDVKSAVLNKIEGKLVVAVSGASIMRDSVDVTKLSLKDNTTGKTYQLTNAVWTGSRGCVKSETTLEIKLGSADLIALQSFGTTNVTMTVAPGSLLIDAAGNVSAPIATPITIPVTIVEW